MSISETLDAVGRYPTKWRMSLSQITHIFRRAIREPLVHFAVAGFVLFLAGRLYQEQTSVYRIVETPQHTAELANQYRLQFGSLPDGPTLDSLVKRDIHDEVLFRQGLALGLDKDDEIVRRRVVQKMQFLLQDLNAPPEPTEKQLAAFYRAHAKNYVLPARVTFSHIYFSADTGGDNAAQARAKTVLAKLPPQTTRAPDLGDPFPDLYDFSNYDREQVLRLFGHTAFADALFKAPAGHWIGPVRSGYGWHLIYVDARTEPHQPPLSQVRDQVRTDYLQAAQDKANKKAFSDLARQFTVVREDEKPKR